MIRASAPLLSRQQLLQVYDFYPPSAALFRSYTLIPAPTSSRRHSFSNWLCFVVPSVLTPYYIMHYARSAVVLAALQLVAHVSASPVARAAGSPAAATTTDRPTITVRIGRCLLTDGLSSTASSGGMGGSTVGQTPTSVSGGVGGSAVGPSPIIASSGMGGSTVGPSPTIASSGMGGPTTAQTGTPTPSVMQSAGAGS